jgi:hypothetical protein
MKVVKRWGVMALVILLVLGSMGAALADDATESEPVKDPPEAGSYSPAYDWAADLVAFVFYWGLGESDELPPCDVPDADGAGGMFLPPVELVEEPVECVALNVEGPNGQVNHGSMVSSFVHWLKDGGAEMLNEELQAMPKGQLVKRFAHDDFGKGFFELNGEIEAEDADDGNGPPDWVKAKKADKVKGKKK